MTHPTEQFLETIDVRELNELRWPIVRLLAPSFVDRMELRRHNRRLLETGLWDRIRAVPYRHPDGKVSSQVFELYGTPAVEASKRCRRRRSG